MNGREFKAVQTVRSAVTCMFLLASAPLVPAQQAPAPCASIASLNIPVSAVGLPTSGIVIRAAAEMNKGEAGGEYCRVTGWIRPVDPAGFDINFQVNLPTQWNRKAIEFGGAGFDGNVVSGLGVAQRGGDPPLNRGYITLGGDSGHPSALGPAFGLNDEALESYGSAAIKKTHDVAVALARARYGAFLLCRELQGRA